jgi:hypothetical protein
MKTFMIYYKRSWGVTKKIQAPTKKGKDYVWNLLQSAYENEKGRNC